MTVSNYVTRIVEDRPKSGMWHCGPNNCWVTITHIPTMQSATVYGMNEWKTRQYAMSLIEMIVEDCQLDSCWFPERLT